MGSAVAVTGLEKKNVNKCRIGHAVKRVNTSHQHDISSCFAVLLSSFGKKKKYRECFHFLLLQIFCISFFVSNIFLCSGVLFDFWLRRFRSSASSFSFFFLSQLGPGMNEWERRAQKKRKKGKKKTLPSFRPPTRPMNGP